MKKILRPSYTSRFQCIGQDCKYTCCAVWKIDLEEEEAQRIWNSVSEKIDLFPDYNDKFILPIGEKNGKKQYKFGFSEDGTCKFLSSESLCSLQIHCGSRIIPQICKVFPRGYIYYLNQMELYLSPACERVIELLIEEKQSIRLITTKEKFSEDTLMNAFTKMDILKTPILKYYYDIKTLGMSILQNPHYTVEQRLLVLGIAMKELNRLSQSDEMDGVQKYINGYMDQVDSDEFFANIKSFAGNKQMKIWNSLVLINTLTDGWLECTMNRVNTNLGVIETVIDEKDRRFEVDMDLYQLRKKQFDLFFKDKPYTLENIIVNWYLYSRQPFTDKGIKIWDNYLAFTVMVSLYLFVITCLAEQDWKVEDFIHETVIMSRALVHSESIIKGLAEYYNASHAGSLADLAIMLLD